MTDPDLPVLPAIMMNDGPEQWTSLAIKTQYDMIDFATGFACATIPALSGIVCSKEAEERLLRMFDNRAVVARDGQNRRVVKVACQDVAVLERIQAATRACDDVLTTRAILWALNPEDWSHFEPTPIRNVREGVAAPRPAVPDDHPEIVAPMSTDATNAMIAAMTGPERGGNHVIVDGRLVPNLAMRDAGAFVEFVLDNRTMFRFPRDWAPLAATFAFHAMAVGAGFGAPGGLHDSARAFGIECSTMESSET